ncbi:MAG: PstS family phosphate ABC transporter substrate-binding protein [Desulfomonile tiedjei]|nr:PstS family phosphate ABC transporter substrate-binding protein [Desulfomonile tiedjei]
MRRFPVVELILAALGVVLICALDSLAQDGKAMIRVRGADSVAGRVDQLARVYMKDHPDVNVVVLGGAKTIGLPSLLDKSGEVAMAPRKATDTERREASDKGIELVERLIGHGGIAIVLHQDNPVGELTIEQVQKILKGDYDRWDQVGGLPEPITVFSVGEMHQGTVHFLENDLLGKASITKKAEVVSTFDTVMRRVAETKGSIGFTRIRDALESPVSQQVQFKIIKLKQNVDAPAILLTREAVANGSYPLKRPFFLYLDANAKPEVKGFVDFIIGKGWGSQKL